MYFTQEQLNDWIPLLEARGFQIHAHTLGDRSMAAVLDALEKSRELRSKPNDRPAFIHCYLIDPNDYPRLQAANASVNFTMLWRQLEPMMVELNQSKLGAELPLLSSDQSGVCLAPEGVTKHLKLRAFFYAVAGSILAASTDSLVKTDT
jgi:predicted amidohydrolase YtcJ